MKVHLDRRIEDKGVAFDTLLKKFKKLVKSEGIIQECKKREFYLSKTQKRAEKDKQAAIRNNKKSKNKIFRKVLIFSCIIVKIRLIMVLIKY